MLKFDSHELRDAVYEIVQMIPKGRATSYGAIASAIGYPNHARHIGRIVGESGRYCRIPAHRVVNSSGVLTGRGAFKTPTEMSDLLAEEGVIVKNNRIANWRKVFWDPSKEMII